MRFLVTEKLGPHKFKTPEGYLICTDAILSRTGKQEYKRCELFGDACEDPDKIVNIERTDDEVFSDKAMASFENKAVCIEHPDHDVNAENHNELAVGFVRDIHKGEDNGKPVMMGTLVITDKDAVEAVESGEYKELSCGYDCDIDDDDEPCQRNIRGNHVALCKQGRAGIARIVDSVKDLTFNRMTEEAKKLKEELGMYARQAGSHKSTGIVPYKTRQSGPQVKELNEAINEAIQQLQNGVRDKSAWNRLAIKLEAWEDDPEMTSIAKRAAKAIRKFEVFIGDSDMKDIQSTKAPGTDKIIYVMQSDIDKNLYFYIGKIFSMKEGNWGYTKFEMGNTTPDELKSELVRNGWHQVPNGPARVIDMNDERLIKRTELNVGMNIRWKHHGEQYEGRIKRVEQKGSYTKIDYEDKRGIGASFAFENEPITTTDSWTEVEEENYKKANNPIGAKDEEYVQLPRGRFIVVTKTKEELEKEGYGYHHSDNGYSVYVKNNSAVAIKDAVELSGLYKNDNGDAIKVTRNRFSYDVQFGEDSIFNKGWSYPRSYDSAHLLKYLKQNRLIKVSKLNYLKDMATLIDANYEQWTKQGWRVAALYKDGGRIHAIVERKSGDFVVALGYNTSTGEWAQGRYVSTFGAAVDTLNEEKPGAVPIRDAKPAKKTFEVSFVKDDVTYVRKVKADSLQDAIVKAKDEVSTAHKVVVFTQNMLSEMGKNNSIGKYDRVISAMRQLYGQSLLPDDKLKEAIRRELPRLLKKYVNE